MSIDLQGSDLNKFILVGDRILIKPKNLQTKQDLGYIYHLEFKKMKKFIVVM